MASKAPKPDEQRADPAERVFDLLCRRRPRDDQPGVGWVQLAKELGEIGPSGLDGYVRAMACPYWAARKTAVSLMRFCESPETVETLVVLMTRALSDSDKKVRRSAAEDLLGLDVPEERKRREFVPRVLPLLDDASKRVRLMAAWSLRRFAEVVPLATAARSVVNETDPKVRHFKDRLLRSVLDAGERAAQ